MGVLVPEIQIFNAVKAILEFIRTDFDNFDNEEDTLLFRICGDNNLQRYNFFEQAKTVFLAKPDNPRFLDVNVFFNMERANIPTIHITLPAEQSDKDGLSLDEGYRGYQEVKGMGGEDQQKPNYTRRFSTQYQLVVTSDNSNEVVMIYHLLRGILIPVIDHFNMVGLENIKLSGRDIQNMNTIVPTHIFMRAIGLALEYEVTVESLFPEDIIQQICTKFSVLSEPPTGREEVIPLAKVLPEGVCLPPACSDATIENSDSTYAKDIGSGDIFVLKDINHTDSDGNIVILPAQTPMVCTPIPTPVPINISNYNNSYSVDTLEDHDLPNINFTDSDGTTTSIPSMEDIVAIPTPVKAGIKYKRPNNTGQTLQYRVGDDYWRQVNMPYPADPVNPLYEQELGANWFTLLHPNEFGNYLRFTDTGGNATTVDNYVDIPDWNTDRYIIDNLTGLGWYYSKSTTTSVKSNWNNAIDSCLSSTQDGYGGWYLPNSNELLSIFNSDGNLYSINIMWMGGNRTQYTSTTSRVTPTRARHFSSNGILSFTPKTNNWYYHQIRVHF